MSKKYLAKHVASLKPSGIRKFFDIVATMDDVISLGIGEPDFITPKSILGGQSGSAGSGSGFSHDMLVNRARKRSRVFRLFIALIYLCNAYNGINDRQLPYFNGLGQVKISTLLPNLGSVLLIRRDPTYFR